ncbi:ABC transporter permease [uncultured Aquimarina sp.]|uniref:ABC transporter permease n=1 Tax=uncultured Aquimarina sp. TaxID=575652 RepID=UPI00260BCB6B|nr:ABC transporter permease [uncultured Aquimarina sp.]
MKYYFLLQYKRIYRSFKDFGTEPFIGYPIIIILFYWMSSSIFENILYANYIYALISIFFTYAIGNSEHRRFVKQHFSIANYRKIIVLNNMLKVTPFAMFLLYKTYYIEVFLVYGLAFLVSLTKKRTKVSLMVPTPFGKKPFEFVIGFRKTFWLFLLIYCLTIIAVYKGNFNLGVFSLVSVFFVCSSYFMKPDSDFYIWIHAMNSREFLRHKIAIALRNSFVLALPILIGLSIFYFDQLHITLFFLFAGFSYMLMYLLMKYSFQNQGMEIFQGIIGILCLLFPPILIIAIPYFYNKTIKNLDLLLK